MEELNALVDSFLKAGYTPDQIKEELTQYLKEHQPKGLPVGGFVVEKRGGLHDGLGIYEYKGLSIRMLEDEGGQIYLVNDFDSKAPLTKREKEFVGEHLADRERRSKPRASRIPEDQLKKAKAIHEIEMTRQKHGAWKRISDEMFKQHKIVVTVDTLKNSWFKPKK